MPSAPPRLAQEPRRRRSTGEVSRRERNTRGSAPARLGSAGRGPRRAISASPGARRWSGPFRATAPGRKVRPTTRRTVKAGLLGLLALTGGAGGPYVGAPGKSLAVWPLGSSGPVMKPSTMTYKYGPLPPALAVEVLPRAKRTRLSRKLFPGSYALSGMYEPEMLKGPRVSRKLMAGRAEAFPLPTITSGDVRYLENKGFIFPKKVHNQAQLGHAIIGDAAIPEWARAPEYRRTVAAMLSTRSPARNKYSIQKQLALPAPVQRKLKALENRAKAAAVRSTVQVVTAPWKVAAGARRATGYIFGLPGRGLEKVRQTIKAAREVHNAARRRTTRPVA